MDDTPSVCVNLQQIVNHPLRLFICLLTLNETNGHQNQFYSCHPRPEGLPLHCNTRRGSYLSVKHLHPSPPYKVHLSCCTRLSIPPDFVTPYWSVGVRFVKSYCSHSLQSSWTSEDLSIIIVVYEGSHGPWYDFVK